MQVTASKYYLTAVEMTENRQFKPSTNLNRKRAPQISNLQKGPSI